MHDFGEPSKDLNTLSTAEDPGPPTKRVEKIVGWHPHRGFDIITCVSLSLSLSVCVCLYDEAGVSCTAAAAAAAAACCG